MENSITKAWETTTNDDGSVEISFSSWRWGAHQSARLAPAMALVLFPASCAVTYPLVSTTKSINIEAWFVLSLVLMLAMVYFARRKQTKILVKPKQGIVFNGTSIPFSGIDSIGTYHETTGNDVKGSSYIYVETNGREVRISGHAKPALVTAIKNEIVKFSGVSWT